MEMNNEAADNEVSDSSSEELRPIEHDTQTETKTKIYRLYTMNEIDIALYKDPLLYTGIMRDVLFDDKNQLMQKLSSGMSVRVRDRNGNSLLHLAVYATRDDMSLIDLLLQQEGIEINAVNLKSTTPLVDSILLNNSLIATHLMKAGADVNFPSIYTPLHTCLQFGSSEICQALILAGADFNVSDFDGDTPLHLAVNYDHFEMMCMLLYYGAEMRPNEILRPFTFSVFTKKFDYADMLLEYETEFDSFTLEIAIMNGYPNLESLVLHILKEEKNLRFTPKKIPLSALLNNITVFDLVWKNLQIECDFDDFVRDLFHGRFSDKYNFLKVLDVLKTSRQELMMKLVESSERCPFLYPLIMKVADVDPHWDVYEICAVFLSYGLVVWDVDLDVVFEIYGYCELFQLMLQMDIRPTNLPRINLVPYLYYSVDDLMSFHCRVVNLITKMKTDHSSFNTSGVPSDELLPTLTCIDRFNCYSKVPKLTELARNKLRDELCIKNKIKNSRQFYTMLKLLPFANYVKKFISLEFPIYKQSKSTGRNPHASYQRLQYFKDMLAHYNLGMIR